MQEESNFRAFKNMMEGKYSDRIRDSDEICGVCSYHMPEFKYRFCQFTECKYIKGFKTYRERFYE